MVIAMLKNDQESIVGNMMMIMYDDEDDDQRRHADFCSHAVFFILFSWYAHIQYSLRLFYL